MGREGGWSLLMRSVLSDVLILRFSNRVYIFRQSLHGDNDYEREEMTRKTKSSSISMRRRRNVTACNYLSYAHEHGEAYLVHYYTRK